jgi:hypothetical protein
VPTLPLLALLAPTQLTQAQQQAVEKDRAMETLQLAKELLILDYKVVVLLNPHMRTRAHTHASTQCMLTFSAYTHTHSHTHTHIHKRTKHTNAHKHKRTYTYTYTYIDVHTHSHTRINIHTQTHTNSHTRTHTYNVAGEHVISSLSPFLIPTDQFQQRPLTLTF